MKYGMHVFLLVDTVENSACNVTDAFCNNPTDRCGIQTVKQGLEGNEDGQSHDHETKGLKVAVVLELVETGDGADNRTCPDEDE